MRKPNFLTLLSPEEKRTQVDFFLNSDPLFHHKDWRQSQEPSASTGVEMGGLVDSMQNGSAACWMTSAQGAGDFTTSLNRLVAALEKTGIRGVAYTDVEDLIPPQPMAKALLTIPVEGMIGRKNMEAICRRNIEIATARHLVINNGFEIKLRALLQDAVDGSQATASTAALAFTSLETEEALGRVEASREMNAAFILAIAEKIFREILQDVAKEYGAETKLADLQSLTASARQGKPDSTPTR